METTDFDSDELSRLEGLDQEQLNDLNTTFNGLVSWMDSMHVRRSEVAGMAHQSHHLGWDYALMEAMAEDARTLARAEGKLRQINPGSSYFIINEELLNS